MIRLKSLALITFLMFKIFEINTANAVGATAAATAGANALLLNPYCQTSAIIPDVYGPLLITPNFSGACQTAAIGVNAETAIALAADADLSLAQQTASVAQQVLTVQNLVIQTQQLIKDIEENPLQVILPDVEQIVRNQKRIAKLAHDIDKNSSAVGDNLIKNLDYPASVGLGQGSRFQLWSHVRKQAIDESFSTVKGFLKDLADEDRTVSEAIKNLNGARGQRANAKALSNAAGQQLTFLGKIEETLLKTLSLNAAQAGANLEREISAEESSRKKYQGLQSAKPSDDIEDKGDITVSNHPSFFGLRSVK